MSGGCSPGHSVGAGAEALAQAVDGVEQEGGRSVTLPAGPRLPAQPLPVPAAPRGGLQRPRGLRRPSWPAWSCGCKSRSPAPACQGQTGRWWGGTAEHTGRQDACGSRGHGHSGVTRPPWLLRVEQMFWGCWDTLGCFCSGGELSCWTFELLYVPSRLRDRQYAPHLSKGSSCRQHPQTASGRCVWGPRPRVGGSEGCRRTGPPHARPRAVSPRDPRTLRSGPRCSTLS